MDVVFNRELLTRDRFDFQATEDTSPDTYFLHETGPLATALPPVSEFAPQHPVSDIAAEASGFSAAIDVSTLEGSNGFAIFGASSGDASGFSVSSAGDVNGDGIADIVIGAPNTDTDDLQSGTAYVVFGSHSGFGSTLDLGSLDGSDGFAADGPTKFGVVGKSVSSAGDMNGDGFADFIVGSPEQVYSDVTGYVVFGHGGPFNATLQLSTLDGTNGFSITDASSNDGSGQSMASAGDMNGDGFADFIVGARFTGNGPDAQNVGAAYVVFGHGGTFDSNIGLATLNGTDGFKIAGVSAGDEAGRAVAGAGDVNGDGFADVVIGAQYASPDNQDTVSGAAYVVFGHSGPFNQLDLADLDGTNGFVIQDIANNGELGSSVASAGDVNGDGFADIIVGEPDFGTYGTTSSESGASYVIFGHAGGFSSAIDASSLNGRNGFAITGAPSEAESGRTVASAGDVNGDGFADLLIGTNAYTTYVVFGHSGRFSANIDLSTLDGSNGFVIDAPANMLSVSSAGDINGDGFDDLIVGAPYASGPGGGGNYGVSYVIYGQAPDEAVVRKGSDASQTISGGAFDDTLSGFGGDDTLQGNGGNDVLNGGTGDDVMLGSTGNDHLNGSDGNDVLNGGKGADAMAGGDGNDTYVVDNAGDTVVEGRHNGTDTVHTTLSNYTLGDNVENLVHTARGAFTGTGNGLDNIITGGHGAETLDGAAGNDVLHGNGGADILIGGSGADQLAGGGGADTFEYTSVAQSTGATHDRIFGLDFAADHFDMNVPVRAVDAAVTSGAVSQASFDADLAAAIGKGELGRYHAVLFTASSGSLEGHIFLIVDANGHAGYQSGHDYVFDVTGAAHIADLSAATFV